MRVLKLLSVITFAFAGVICALAHVPTVTAQPLILSPQNIEGLNVLNARAPAGWLSSLKNKFKGCCGKPQGQSHSGCACPGHASPPAGQRRHIGSATSYLPKEQYRLSRQRGPEGQPDRLQVDYVGKPDCPRFGACAHVTGTLRYNN